MPLPPLPLGGRTQRTKRTLRVLLLLVYLHANRAGARFFLPYRENGLKKGGWGGKTKGFLASCWSVHRARSDFTGTRDTSRPSHLQGSSWKQLAAKLPAAPFKIKGVPASADFKKSHGDPPM
ncbi:hypothetical protein AMECASPLE_025054 [Ameca splendens]|uniref:Uncharacterized protein n=1 Tax=Ameca splendens TaxID=208324 RepID=A0ABV0XTN9_9TELE